MADLERRNSRRRAVFRFERRNCLAAVVAQGALLVEFGTAWLLTKTTEPLRLVGTIALVPLLRRRAPLPLLRLFGAVPAARK